MEFTVQTPTASSIEDPNSFDTLYRRMFPDNQFHHKPSGSCCTFTINLSDVKDTFNKLSATLQGAASAGNLTCRISTQNISLESAIKLYAALKMFPNKGVTIKDLPEYCRHDKIQNHIEFSANWAADNTFINPKPHLKMPQSPVWGVDLLNVERRQGEGTDSFMVYRQQRIPVHSSIVSKFCPYFSPAGNWKERKEFTLPEELELSPEIIEELISYMYVRELDFAKHSFRQAIYILKLSSFLEADQLSTLAFKHIIQHSEKFTDRDRLLLFFIENEISFPELKTLCAWLMRNRPNFYEGVLKAESIESTDLFMLFDVGCSYNIQGLKDKLEEIWNDMTIQQKNEFLSESIKRNNIALLKLMAKLCKKAISKIPADNPERNAFIEKYKKIKEIIFNHNITTKVIS